jgi:hypothetical protein
MNSKSILLLKLSVIFIFIARAYQHIFWDVPYRAILWYEKMMSPLLGVFNIKWSEFVNDTDVDGKIQFVIKGIGVLYLVAAFLVLLLNEESKKGIKITIKCIAFWQFFVVFLFTKESFFQVGQYLEHSLQLGLPLLLLYFYSGNYVRNKAILILKVVIGITFVSHGLYAFGFYPVPGNFIDMTIAIFGTSEEVVRDFLWVAGVIDVLILPLLFVDKAMKIVVVYAIFWGFLTALARIVANFSMDFPLQTLHQYGFETIVRLCHGLGPLVLFFMINEEEKVLK